VDDEQMILTSLKNALKRMGYDVIALKDSQDAYETFLKAPSGFDLVITDLTMPKLSGLELANKLMDIRSDIPVILCTGFNDFIDEDAAKSIGIRELLLKPASTNELKTAIKRALEN
jgi:DNA-binding NtrC family response regulator